MTPVLTLLCACYALFIRLCPGPFRAEFEEEMKDTFAQAAAEAAGGGWRPLLRLIVVEFSALPVLIISQWWSHVRQKEQTMNDAKLELSPEPARAGRSRWTDALLAALPHFLLGALTALSSSTPSWVNYGLLITMVAAFFLAWRKSWPLWSGSWAGYWLLFPYFWLGSLLPWLRGLDYLLALPPIAVVLYLFVRRPLYGLLASVAPLLLMTHIFAFELVAGGEWVWSGIWLLLGVTAGAILWLGSMRAGVVLTVAFQFAAGLIISVARSYLPYRGLGPTDMGPRPTPDLATLVNDFAPLTLAAITLPLALLLLRPLGRLAGRGGQRGRRSHKVLFLGTAVTLGGVLALRARPDLVDATSGALAAAAVAAGLLLSLGAAVALIRATRSAPIASWRDLLLPLLAAFAPLVVFALPHPFPTAGQYSGSFQVQVTLSYAGVLAWTLLTILTLVGGPGNQAQKPLWKRRLRGLWSRGKSLTEVNRYQRFWRIALLILLVVAAVGPWTGDRIHVPAEYDDCSPPYIRTEGDMCDMIGVFGLISGFLRAAGWLVTDPPADLLSSLFFTGIYFLYMLPIFSTLLLLLLAERQHKLNVLAWSLAIIAFIFSSVIGAFPPSWMWGLRLYIGVAIGALILELSAFVADKYSDPALAPER